MHGKRWLPALMATNSASCCILRTYQALTFIWTSHDTQRRTLQPVHRIRRQADFTHRQTPSWIAKRIGVTDKRIRYILDGERTVKGETTPIQMTYTEQFALECLVAEAIALRR